MTRKVKSQLTGEIGCVKLLSKQSDVERRMRFAREANAYDTIHHPLIPRLLASNALHHGDAAWKLFLVTEFVPGPTLSQRIEESGSLEWDAALRMTGALLGVVDCLHGALWVHRDIKSDNIILRDGDVARPVLLDFGIGYSEDAALTLQTEQDQEIGNRFLRLPEHAVGSADKRDPRSDLAYVGGILFYALTGMLPATLLDGEGRMPHQRREAREKLVSAAGAVQHELLDLFDRSFNTQVSMRYSNATEMRAALEMLTDKNPPVRSGPDEDFAFIKTHLARGSVAEQSQLSGNCMAVFRGMEGTTKQLVNELNGQFVHTQGGLTQRETSVRTKLGLAKSADHAVRFSPVWEINVQGAEIVVTSSSGFRFRLNAAAPDVKGEFHDEVRAHLLRGVRSLIEDPSAQAVHHGYFRTTPHSSLAEAVAEGNRVDMRVFAVVFDDQHPQLSELDYALGNFMKYEETKDFVEANFLTAIVTAANARELVPAGTLEAARWFLLGTDGTVLKEANVYANPDEGLKEVKRLAAHGQQES